MLKNFIVLILLIVCACSQAALEGKFIDATGCDNETSAEEYVEEFNPTYSILYVIRNVNPKLFKHLKAEGIKTNDQINTLKKLDLSHPSSELLTLESLQGIEQLHNLELLNLSGHEINDLSPLVYTFIDVYQDGGILSEKELVTLPNLKTLKLNNCKIKDISRLKFFSDLETLELDDNKIEKSKHLNDFKKLNYFSIKNNPLKDAAELKVKLAIIERCNPTLFEFLKTEKIDSDLKIETTESLELNRMNASGLDSSYGLRFFTNLKELNIASKTMPNLSDLLELEHLEEINIRACLSVDSKTIKRIRTLKRLKYNEEAHPELNGWENFNLNDIQRRNQILYQNLIKLKIASDQAILNTKKLYFFDSQDSQDLESLDGIEYFSNLQNLDLLKTPKIDDLSPLKRLIHLKKLNLSTISTGNISCLSALTELEELSLSYMNQFDESNFLVIRGFKKLQELCLYDCNLTSINGLEDMQNIKRVLLGKNKIDDISSLATCNKICEINLEENGIERSLKCEKISSLNKLNLVNNLLITDYQFLINFPSLNDLSLSARSGPGSRCFNPKSIDMINNLKLFSINQENPALETELLKKNITTDVGVLKQKKLILKDVSQLKSLSGLEYFTSLKTLEIENCSGIQDYSTLKNLKSLNKLTIKNSNFSDLAHLSVLSELSQLRLQGNQITDITPIVRLHKLEELHLQNNQITDITRIDVLCRLKKLHLQNNQITNITRIGGLDKLEELHLQNNQITNLEPLKELSSLNRLYIKGNVKNKSHKKQVARDLPIGLVVDSKIIKANLPK